MKQVISVQASFQQKPIVCTATKNRSDSFVLKLYDAANLDSEPIWELKAAKTTKAMVTATSSNVPRPENDGKQVQVNFGEITIPENGPERIYAVVWRDCSGERLVTTDPDPIYEPILDTQSYGGEFFRFTCPGKSITTRCVYRHG